MYKRVLTKLNGGVCSGAGYLLTTEPRRLGKNLDLTKPRWRLHENATEQSLFETVQMRRQVQFGTSWRLTAGFLSARCSRICSFMRSCG